MRRRETGAQILTSQSSQRNCPASHATLSSEKILNIGLPILGSESFKEGSGVCHGRHRETWHSVKDRGALPENHLGGLKSRHTSKGVGQQWWEQREQGGLGPGKALGKHRRSWGWNMKNRGCLETRLTHDGGVRRPSRDSEPLPKCQREPLTQDLVPSLPWLHGREAGVSLGEDNW